MNKPFNAQTTVEGLMNTKIEAINKKDVDLYMSTVAKKDENFSKFDMNSLLRGDQKTRAEFYNKMFNLGAYSPNEIRTAEDMNPYDGGDKHYVMLNMGDATKKLEEQPRGTSMNHKENFSSIVNNAVETVNNKERKFIEKGKKINSKEQAQYAFNTLCPVMQSIQSIKGIKCSGSYSALMSKLEDYYSKDRLHIKDTELIEIFNNVAF